MLSNPVSLNALARRGADVPPDVGAAPAGPSTLRVVAWTDPVIDTLGHDPRSWYVEQFWLPVIGPTSTWLMRRIVARFDSDPGGFDLDLDDTARGLGSGGTRRTPLPLPARLQPLRRLSIGPAPRSGCPRCPASDPAAVPSPSRPAPAHPPGAPRRVVASPEAAAGSSTRRATALAGSPSSSSTSGPTDSAVELQLVRWRIHPAMAHEATQWALSLPATS